MKRTLLVSFALLLMASASGCVCGPYCYRPLRPFSPCDCGVCGPTCYDAGCDCGGYAPGGCATCQADMPVEPQYVATPSGPISQVSYMTEGPEVIEPVVSSAPCTSCGDVGCGDCYDPCYDPCYDACPPCGGCCDPCCNACCRGPISAVVHAAETVVAAPIAWVGSLFSAHCYYGPSCGETYYGDWYSSPPDCCEPCGLHGEWIGDGCSTGQCGAYAGGSSCTSCGTAMPETSYSVASPTCTSCAADSRTTVSRRPLVAPASAAPSIPPRIVTRPGAVRPASAVR